MKKRREEKYTEYKKSHLAKLYRTLMKDVDCLCAIWRRKTFEQQTNSTLPLTGQAWAYLVVVFRVQPPKWIRCERIKMHKNMPKLNVNLGNATTHCFHLAALLNSRAKWMVGNATLHVSCGSLTLCYLYLISLIPGHTQSVGVSAISFTSSLCFGVFWSSFLFMCHWIPFVFSYDWNICTIWLDPLFLTIGEFQAWDWLWYPLTCGPRGGVGVHMGQKSWANFLPWPVFEPRTSHLTVQHATARLYCIVSIHLYNAFCSAHQSEALPVRETQREESSLKRMKRGTWLNS